jgi:hypothetical protein
VQLFWHKDKTEKEIEEILREEKQILSELQLALAPRLSFIKLKFVGGKMPEGPVTLTVGQKTVASVDGFDQNGAPFTGAMPAATFSVDSPTIDSIDPVSGAVVSLAAGTANITATLITAEGKSLSDTETATNVAQAPVLSSVKINFSTPA